ncbi:hypothetical protein HN371_04880 [Candidatus Poribacteria bacterium]|jgi:predicted small lipoprotein YifL|nr:hypothetical protein [Candidatus Poribacteria bacterium]MBT5536233.1 hypothetical protein [Candidatus Poribacteria bacterium]MBT5712851.1 hypothetical protein [Candidatus Poribacteria bacterium]MBT7101023.1 hypothetical protein [Candidatus Poribacteria bacterium]MBT7806743.1 hypothetical protein [Candidatus Poribacteria bacterium]
MKRVTYPIAAIAAAAVIGCGSKAPVPMAQDMAPPEAQVQTTLASATLSVTGMR